MKKVALFPGSFDPITVGHVDIIVRAEPLFDELFIGVGTNSGKQPMFPSERRADWIREIFQYTAKNVNVLEYKGLTVECAKAIGAKYIVRGIRYVNDFESEKAIADINRQIGGIETVFFTCLPEHGHVASTLVRELLKNNGDITPFVPEAVLKGISL
jgi:pantetheine-phosphate adenylyltransferase